MLSHPVPARAKRRRGSCRPGTSRQTASPAYKRVLEESDDFSALGCTDAEEIEVVGAIELAGMLGIRAPETSDRRLRRQSAMERGPGSANRFERQERFRDNFPDCNPSDRGAVFPKPL